MLVYVPYSILEHSEALMFGNVLQGFSKVLVCLHSIPRSDFSFDETKKSLHTLKYIGVWKTTDDFKNTENIKDYNLFISEQMSTKNEQLFHISFLKTLTEIHYHIRNNGDSSTAIAEGDDDDNEVEAIIFFDLENLLKSEIISELTPSIGVDENLYLILTEYYDCEEDIELIQRYLLLGSSESKMLSSKKPITFTNIDREVKDSTIIETKIYRERRRFASTDITDPLLSQSSVKSGISQTSQINMMRRSLSDETITLSMNSQIWNIIQKSSFVSRLYEKMNTFHDLTTNRIQSRISSLPYLCSLSNFLTDLLLGVLVIFLLTWFNFTDRCFEVTLISCDFTGKQLDRLLRWMMGEPAGLKLNHPLSSFLGNFFLYHIYLWLDYLQYIAPILRDIFFYTSLSGFFGITVLLCLIRDLLFVITIHIYCFYVYAAKLYYYQISAVIYLWRVFRGRKWNVETKKIDYYNYTVMQLFAGTLIFTTLLFSLPTTALYYFVFTVLRLGVLLIDGILYRIVAFLVALPVAALVFKVTGIESQRITNRSTFSTSFLTSESCLVLNLHLRQMSLIDIFHRFRLQCDPQLETWVSMIRKLIFGELLYPWIKSRNLFSVQLLQ